MEAASAILTRRSTRRYRKEQIDRSVLDKIIEAGRYAPSGGNSQTSHFFVIADQEVLDQLKEIVQNAFKEMDVYEGMYPSMRTSITLSKQGNYAFHYNAPCLIVLANRKDYGNNMADVACCLENMMIMANAYDLGSCWINQLKWLNENEEVLRFFETFGLKEEERIYGALALGYPGTENGLPERKQIERQKSEL